MTNEAAPTLVPAVPYAGTRRAAGRAAGVLAEIAALVGGAALVLSAAPVLVLLRLLLPVLPGPVRAVARLVLLYGVYLVVFELPVLWAVLRLRVTPPPAGQGQFQTHLPVLRRASARFFGPGLTALGLRPQVEQPVLDPDRPVVLLMRHAGVLNTQLALHFMVNRLERVPHAICKRAVTADPALAALIRPLALYPIRWDTAGRFRALRHLMGIGRELGAGDVAVVFPEGTNFSRRRQRRSAAGAEGAVAGGCVLPAMSGGARAVLAAAPEAQIVFVGHTGLEDLLPWRLGAGYPSSGRGRFRVACWSVERSEVPRGKDEFARWLDLQWVAMDRWVRAARAERG
ncbi:1-acyl-sn-glycerol-3-phosphate acyltransferase [Kitasatospora sp. NPDC101801]|uniref:1-acyl-sn-glycerol-3-phosphate acyltransferase n=1 Tax=Kitasatospora sp. NPDC101801 TaxID=3364103 RepID=UPI0037F700B1